MRHYGPRQTAARLTSFTRSQIARCAIAVLCSSALMVSTVRADAPLRDPLLTPLPPPRRIIHGWSEAASLLRARSTELSVAAADEIDAEARSRGAVASLLGTVRLDGAYTVNAITNTLGAGLTTSMGTEVVAPTQLPQRGYGLATVTATLPLIAPRAWVAVKTGALGEELAQASFQEVERTLLQRLTSTVIAAVAAEKTAELSRGSLTAAIDRLELVTRKKALGGGTLLDVVRGQQDLQAARAEVVATSENVRQSREALGLVLGLKEEVGVDAGLRLDAAVAEVLASCHPLDDIGRRADIVAATSRVAIAHQVVSDARAEFFPTVGLQAVGSTTNQALDPYPQTQWSIEGLISWNLWDGGTRYADLRRGSAQQEAASARLEQAHRNEEIEVSRARRAVRVAESARQVAEQETAFAVEQDRLTRTAYETGQGTSLELIAAASAHRAQEINLALREFDVVNARLNAIFVSASCKL